MNDSFSSPSSSTARYFSSSSTTTSSSNDEKNERNINLLSSQRGRDAVGLLPKYLSDARAVQKYHPVDCPDGALQLSVAENQMLEDLLVPAYRNFIQNDKEEKETFLADQIYYQPTHGRPGLRNAMAQFLTKLLNLSSSNSSLKEDNLIMGAGCNAVLENLAFTLANPGDVILIPTPYYAAFEFDLVARAGLQIIPVETQRVNMMEKQDTSASTSLEEKKDDNKANNNTTPIPKEAYYPTRKSLDIAYENCMEQTGGKPPKILLLSHPNNPLGVCYPPHVIRECIDWSIENKVHLISDEIYAGSVYKEGCFTSALSLASTTTEDDSDSESKDKGLGLGPYIHFVYALSKDFASSGLRVGVAYTENEEILLPMQKLNDLCQISSQTQLLVERMLSDDESNSWSFDFLKENNMRIHKRVTQLMKLLDQYQITYLEPDSGLFLWMDLREFLSPSSDDDDKEQKEEKSVQDHEDLERELYLDLMHNHGLLFTPGMSMRNAEAGFFRLVFTAATDQEFELALERLEKFIVSKRS
eukprot:CAMPEP_0178981052 /NCGR_PEP_ID=MMETSP0789-20121207/26842_1 /TAXON_ID=3005 /ORGANISM="Rhizosolenia setigera, Strain CCMP 1694" /LENGTH=528 /DNA_ID=CAMNT_0020671543 /DNA_START=128 /DNA_END=1714 /DNA_ORIENTATION=-